MRAAVPGLIQGSNHECDTGICETEAGIGFGLAVGQGAESDQGVTLGAADLNHFRGVSVRDVTLGAEKDTIMVPDSLSVLKKGSIWTKPAVAVVANDPVYFNATTGVFSNAGGIGPVPGARWKSSADADGMALVELSGHQRS